MFYNKLVKDRGKALALADKLTYMLLIAFVMLCFTTYHAVVKKPIITLTPPYLDARMQLAYSSANEQMHLKWGMYNAVMIGNVTPSSIADVVNALEYTFTPNLYHNMKAQLQSQATELAKSGSTVSFQPKTWEYEKESNLTFVTGTQIITPLHGTPRHKTVTYEFIIEVNNYVPYISHFDLYPDVPRNKHWRAEQNASQQPS